MTLLDTIILGIVEGLTEFLPISSTGHMILASWLLKMENTDFLKTFEIVIQLGAILAVVGIYYKRLLSGLNIYYKLAAAFIPTGVVGILAHHAIKTYLFNVYVVSGSLILGGVVLIYIDKYISSMPYGTSTSDGDNSSRPYAKLEDISFINAIKIGFIQCISMIPGISRAAATIIGGISVGYDVRQATEFSFLLAIPTMIAATGYELYKTLKALKHPLDGVLPTGFNIVDGHIVLGQADYMALAVGMIIAFVVAWVTVRMLITLVVRYGFKYFGYYRIAIGITMLVLALVFHYNLGE